MKHLTQTRGICAVVFHEPWERNSSSFYSDQIIWFGFVKIASIVKNKLFTVSQSSPGSQWD